MNTIPDHDGECPPRPVPVPSQSAALLALVRRFAPDGWEVENPHGEYWLALRVRGSEQRIIVAQSVIALYGKLQRIASDESAQPPGYPDAVAAYLADLDRLGRAWNGQPASAAPRDSRPVMTVPSCPACLAAPSEITWIGGAPPDSADHWRCSACAHDWTTPPTCLS